MRHDDRIKVVQADSIELLRAVQRLRYRVYVEEQGISVPWADHAQREMRDDLDAFATSFVILHDGAVVGSLRLADLDRVSDKWAVEDKYSLHAAVSFFGELQIVLTSRFIVDGSQLSVKRAMIDLIGCGYRFLLANGRRLAIGDCSPDLTGFYLKMGYRVYTEPFFDSVFGLKVPLMLVLRDLDWFRRVRSPFLLFSDGVANDTEAGEWFSSTYGQCGIDSSHGLSRHASEQTPRP